MDAFYTRRHPQTSPLLILKQEGDKIHERCSLLNHQLLHVFNV
jgi:hypothetical protein